MHVTLKPRTGKLIEAHHGAPQMSLIDANGQAYHEPINCKDYITDAFWSEHHKKPCEVYGFEWKPGILPLDEEWYYLAINYKDLKDKAEGLQSFLNQIEDGIGITRSTVYTTQEDRIIAIKFHRGWTETPYLISAFTQYARSGLSYKEGNVIDHLKSGPMICSFDKYRMAEVATRTETLMSGKKFTQTYKQYTQAMRAHNESGLISWPGLKKA